MRCAKIVATLLHVDIGGNHLRFEVASEIRGSRERVAGRAEPVVTQVEGRAEEQDVGVGAKVAVQAVEDSVELIEIARALGQRSAAIQPLREAHRLFGRYALAGRSNDRIDVLIERPHFRIEVGRPDRPVLEVGREPHRCRDREDAAGYRDDGTYAGDGHGSARYGKRGRKSLSFFSGLGGVFGSSGRVSSAA